MQTVSSSRTSIGERDQLYTFAELYEQHHRRIYALCLRMTRNTAEAEDLMHDVFMQVFRCIDTYRGESSFATWLHRVAVNQVLMHFRRRGVRLEQITDDGEMPVQVVPGTEKHERMPVVERIALEKAIAQLSPGYRVAFVLHDIEGYQHDEIAHKLGVSVGTSRSQLHKARMKLRQLLKARTTKAPLPNERKRPFSLCAP